MHPNAELIERFYTSFQRRDAEGMVACYDPAIVFSDPVFQTLGGGRAGAMWRMLVGRSKDIEISFRDIQADDERGAAHWEATYTYSATGRKVHNVIDASFRFQDGRILAHQDTFDIWKWAGQALGPSGALLGWTPFMQSTIRRRAAQSLDVYMKRQTATS